MSHTLETEVKNYDLLTCYCLLETLEIWESSS
jgi:hypothetical protein